MQKMPKPRGRIFEGEFNLTWQEIAKDIRVKYPNWSKERTARAAKDRRNFNTKHLRAYIKGHQIFHFGVDEFNKPIPFVVQATIL